MKYTAKQKFAEYSNVVQQHRPFFLSKHFFLFAIFILHSPESELYCYVFGWYVYTCLGVAISEVSGSPAFHIEMGRPVKCLAQGKVFSYDSTRGINPKLTDCEEDALTTTPLRRLLRDRMYISNNIGLLCSDCMDNNSLQW